VPKTQHTFSQHFWNFSSVRERREEGVTCYESIKGSVKLEASKGVKSGFELTSILVVAVT
jgi:hypothetical protein